MKEEVLKKVEEQKSILIKIADEIFDNPELCFNEIFASSTLEDYLEKNGFEVERGLGTLKTAFRATINTYQEGRYNIGLLCEYDALPMGHGCGHHMQGPAILGAAVALKETNLPFNLIVYGTPAEEGGGGKIKLLDQGFMKELDIALMMHGGPATQVDVKSMAMSSQKVIFHGQSSHSALKPEQGRSALDALLLSFQGIEFLREHVKEDTKMHYTILETPGAVNVVPDRAVGEFSLRSYNSKYLEEVVERFKKVINGAAMMTETTAEIEEMKRLESKIPAYHLNELLMENAKLINAKNLKPAREKTGSSDFGNVTYIMPGACIRVHFVPDGTSSHSQAFLDYGKTEEAHECIINAAKILAATVLDLAEENNIEKIKQEFKEYKENM
ncbi:M20 family metallopeptidase [Peptoniphilus asaccharolyticus]